MRSKFDQMKVEVKESIDGEVRTFIITLTGPAKEFLMADLLRQRKVIDPFNRQVKQTVRKAIERYLSTAETLVSTLSTKRRRMVRSQTSERGNGDVTQIAVRRLKYSQSIE
ncbi:MAG TPA: hypothetical protein VJ180_01590 [Pyrinomonadaceae bacterium]|nr:hypothetical protein [Pyrinomonadaceae bacterium]